jgi:hypothetical protein
MVGRGPGSIKPLTALSRLRDLQLEYHGSRDHAADPSEWHHLSVLTALTCLRLELVRSDCSGLSRLTTLTNLQDLTLCGLGGPIPEPDVGSGPVGLPPTLAILGGRRERWGSEAFIALCARRRWCSETCRKTDHLR